MLTTPFVLIQSSSSAEWHARSKCWILTLLCGTDASYINERRRLVCGKNWRVLGIMTATTDWTVLRYANQISSQNPSPGYHIAIFNISVFLGGLWIQQNQHFFSAAFQNLLLVLQWSKSFQTWKSITKSALNPHRIKHRPPMREGGRGYQKAVFPVKIK